MQKKIDLKYIRKNSNATLKDSNSRSSYALKQPIASVHMRDCLQLR
jgi:hypothetical protein